MKTLELITLAAAVVAAGCATTLPDPRIDEVEGMLASRTAMPSTATDDPAALDTRISALLARPLEPSGAVQIALVNNPRLRAAYARLGIAAADVYDASRLSNPTVSLGALNSDASSTVLRITAALIQSVTDVVLLSSRREMAAQQAELIRYEVAAELFDFAQDVVAAHVSAVAAKQRAELVTLAAQAMRLSAALAQQYFAAGNINQLELNRAEAAVSEADLDASVAAADAEGALIQMKQVLGISGERLLQLPGGLPLPVPREDDLSSLHAIAKEQRLDLKAATRAVGVHEYALSVTRRYRYLGEIETGVEFERDIDDSQLIGPALAAELPLFNQGQGRVARAEASLEQRRAMLDTLILALEHAIDLAHNRVGAARERVDIYREEFIPARRNIVRRTQEMQNFMIVSPFESLIAKAAEYDAYAGYIDALRDYWLARVSLTREVGTALPSEPSGIQPVLETQTLTAPQRKIKPASDGALTRERGEPGDRQ